MVPFWSCTSRDQHVVNDFSTRQIRNSISCGRRIGNVGALLTSCSSPEFVKQMPLTCAKFHAAGLHEGF